MDLAALLNELPTDRRLALAYAPASARPATAALFVLDARLARIVGHHSEPILQQIRLGWWRDLFAAPMPQGTMGDPLLALLAKWGDARLELLALVNGWEALLAEPPLTAAAVLEFARGRALGLRALAAQLGCDDAMAEAERAGFSWALADLAAKTSDANEAAMICELARHSDWRAVQLPKPLRPLSVLYGLAARKKGTAPLLMTKSDGFAAVRLGLFGR